MHAHIEVHRARHVQRTQDLYVILGFSTNREPILGFSTNREPSLGPHGLTCVCVYARTCVCVCAGLDSLSGMLRLFRKPPTLTILKLRSLFLVYERGDRVGPLWHHRESTETSSDNTPSDSGAPGNRALQPPWSYNHPSFFYTYTPFSVRMQRDFAPDIQTLIHHADLAKVHR